jgi:hypothetical protein
MAVVLTLWEHIKHTTTASTASNSPLHLLIHVITLLIVSFILQSLLFFSFIRFYTYLYDYVLSMVTTN